MTLFTTLGMFIIDENRYINPVIYPDPPEKDIIGGAGTYAIIGARIVSTAHTLALPEPDCASEPETTTTTKTEVGTNATYYPISGIIDQGMDFPEQIETQIKTWKTSVIFRKLDQLTTRGVNTYDGLTGLRSFHYSTPKIRIELEDVAEYRELRESKTYHLICSIERCKQLILGIRKFNPLAKFIYEPLPDDCVKHNWTKLTEILPMIDVFSPNRDEAIALALGENDNAKEENIADDSRITMLSDGELCAKFTTFQTLISNAGTVIRCGARGCHIRTHNGLDAHLPAYHQDQSHVVDVTGGGNSFCGGFMMGWYSSQEDWIYAAVCGNISSGCIVEKLGMPIVEGERFNGLTLQERLHIYYNANPQLLESTKMVKTLKFAETY